MSRPLSRLLCMLCLLTLTRFACAQRPEASRPEQTPEQKKQLKKAIWLGAGGYALSMGALGVVWYSEEGFGKFTGEDDRQKWLQLDKVGHAYSGYHLSNASILVLKSYGVEDKKAIWIGGATGLLMMAPIEVMDGFSKDFGFSYTDILANASGSALSVGQQLLWGEARILPKFAFRQTDFPNNPRYISRRTGENDARLGEGFFAQMIKDYNGQTYWLSFDLARLSGSKNKALKWVNVAVGTGIEDMIHPAEWYNENNYDLNPRRQFYLALDPNFSHIKSKSKFVNALIYGLNMIKIPAPGIEFDGKGGVHWRALAY